MALLLDKIYRFDCVTFKWCLSRKHAGQIAHVARWISRLGDGFLYLFLGILLYTLEPIHGEAFFYSGLVAFALELPLYKLLKNSVKRLRPENNFQEFVAYLVPSDEFSFPSGHTAAAFLMATMVLFYYPDFSALAYLLAIMVGSSRVLLGVHFPSDILAGVVLGSSCAYASLQLTTNYTLF